MHELDQIFAIRWAILIPLAPLLGAVVAGFACTGDRKKYAHWPIWIGVGFAALLSFGLLWQMGSAAHHAERSVSTVRKYFTWIAAGDFKAMWGYFFDPLTAVMLCVVCGIGFLITVFAAGYMKGEEGYFRFFAYLGLFIFMMTNLVMGENLIMLYLGWEGVGLCSYLLIGYYYDKPSAREAAKKAFLVNRVGDFGFALGIMLCFSAFGTVSYFGDGALSTDKPGQNVYFYNAQNDSGVKVEGRIDAIDQAAAAKTLRGQGLAKVSVREREVGLIEQAASPAGLLSTFQIQALHWIPFLLMLGAFGKSAQFPLYVWLPDAMEGPTPVSALIHAATMVTAGVYMIARCGTLFVGYPPAMWTIAIVGAFTAIFAATIAMRQFDLKKVFAYSTVSQLGFMFVGVGCLAPVAGVFHLVTHAFFKALLFLSSGVVMHAMAGELDLRKMSGLKHVLPKTNVLMLIGCAALAGFPFLSGFFSKDEIVGATWGRSRLLTLVMLLTAGMTAYYTFRLYFRVFQGPQVVPSQDHNGHDDEAEHADEHHHHNHEPALMIWPLIVLAIGALFAGFINLPFPDGLAHKLGHFLGKSPSVALTYHVAAPIYNPRSEEVPDASAILSPLAFGQEDERPSEVKDHEHNTHLTFMFASGLIALLGIYLAYVYHLKARTRAEQLAQQRPLLTRILDHKYWVDEIYQAGIVEPLRRIGVILAWIDRVIVDGLVDGAALLAQAAGAVLKITTQRGYLQGYALTMLLGIALILFLMFM